MADEKKREPFQPALSPRRDPSPQPPLQKMAASPAAQAVANNPIFPILSYCGSSILMTVTNKYVLSGLDFNLNFFLLCVQSVVCITAISTCKGLGFISYRDFNSDEAKKWFPISLLLIGMIYTSTKALQFLSIPVYTIFKNLTIILIAYGEVLWFGGSVTGMALFSFGLMVLSSIIAAWADIQNAIASVGGSRAGSVTAALDAEASAKISTLNAGYVWMLLNCFCSATYVLAMRKRIKLTNFKDFDTMYYNNLLSIPVLLVLSLGIESWTPANLEKNFPAGNRDKIITAMVFSGLSSVFISYTSAWCVRTTSSTTYSMVGALNKLPIAISGLVFFDAPVTTASVGAIGVGFVSGIVYAVAKIWQGSANKLKSVLPTSNAPLMSASQKSMRDSFK